MNFASLYLNTLIAEIPRVYNYNNQVIQDYLDVIYDENQGLIIVPINTTGRVKGATGEFVNVITDNLTVKKAMSILFEDTSTYTGSFLTQDGSTVTVVNGIITSVG